MLRGLQVRNFAIVDVAEIDFDDGMTVLTGETGAGKSILVDALGLVLGERGGTGLVRSGAQRAEFAADFDIRQMEHVRNWLADNALDMDDECVLRRVINVDGRSRAFINSTAVPLQSLKALGEMLLDIHGQHFHQSLSRRDVQRDLLDHFGKLAAQRTKTAAAYAKWQTLLQEFEELRSAKADRTSRLELLTFQCQELETLAVTDGEVGELKAERTVLRNSGKLAGNIASALQVLSEDESANANSMLAEAMRNVEALAELDAKLAPVAELLRDADIQLGEATDELRRYAASLDMDPRRADEVEERLDAIQSVARKHQVEPEQLTTLGAELEQQRSSLEHAAERGAQIELAANAAFETYATAATSLSKARHKAAGKLSQAVTAAMADLGMPGGKFVVRANALDAAAGKASGLDEIEYLITANPGQEPAPLAKVASGGELSRMALAIQVIASDGSAIPTMVFDEVDSGVGGGVAEMVGRRLRELGQSRQVFCVTHLPQVASLADHHFRVMKVTDGKSTRTGLSQLTADERIEELARMLGGVKITQKTRDHAAEMLSAGMTSKTGND